MHLLLRAAAYLLGAFTVTLAVHTYLHRRLVVDTGLPAPWRRHARSLSFGLGALLPMGMGGLLLMHDLPRSVAAPLMACAFTWVGALLFLLPLLLASEPLRRVRDPERRRVLARIAGAVAGALTLGGSGTAFAIARLPPVVRRVRVPLSLGRTLVQISDLHVSATTPAGFVESVVAAIEALAPDLVVITGDLVDGSVRELGAMLAPLGRLRPRDGVFFVPGNHEYLSGVDEWLAFVESLGIRVLRNERVAVGGFDLLGVDDPSGSPDLAAALRGRDPARPSILLAHRPDDVEAASRHGIDLQLSGHTHGGQIVPVGWLAERIRQPYVYGAYQVGKTRLHVTSGTGTWGPPMRLGARAEIVLFEL